MHDICLFQIRYYNLNKNYVFKKLQFLNDEYLKYIISDKNAFVCMYTRTYVYDYYLLSFKEKYLLICSF